MATRDDERFRIRIGRPKSLGGSRAPRFASIVLKQMSRQGARASVGSALGADAKFGRGRVAARLTVTCPVSAFGVSSSIALRHAEESRLGGRGKARPLPSREGVTRDGTPARPIRPAATKST